MTDTKKTFIKKTFLLTVTVGDEDLQLGVAPSDELLLRRSDLGDVSASMAVGLAELEAGDQAAARQAFEAALRVLHKVDQAPFE